MARAILLIKNGLILNIEPLLPLPLNGVVFLQIKIGILRLDGNRNAPNGIRLAGPIHIEKIHPEPPMRVHPQETLAQRDKIRYV